MKPLPGELPLMAPPKMQTLLLPRPGDGAAWRRHLEMAQSAGAAAALPCGLAPPRSQVLSDGAGLEPCGMPVAPGPGTPVAAAAAAVVPAGAEGEAEPVHVERQDCDRSPVRVHVERSGGDALRIWIGIDGDAPGVKQQAVSVVAELRRALQGMPERVAAVVCNGATFYAAAAPPRPLRPVGSSLLPLTKDSP